MWFSDSDVCLINHVLDGSADYNHGTVCMKLNIDFNMFEIMLTILGYILQSLWQVCPKDAERTKTPMNADS